MKEKLKELLELLVYTGVIVLIANVMIFVFGG